jgi:hypothetical protein
MATLNADNYASYVADPYESLPVGDHAGKVRMSYDEITLSAELAVNDLINVCAPIPANARIVDAFVQSPSLGTTGIVKLGISGDDDYFVASHDAGGAAAKSEMAGEAGFMIKSSSAIQPILKCTEASDAGSGLKIKVAIFYVLE